MRGHEGQNGWASSMPLVGLVALILAAVMSVTVCAQETTPKPQEQPAAKFKVDSYIPKKFVDLQWKASGGFSADGYDRDEEVGSQSSYRDDGQQLNLSSSASYRHETIPNNWRLGLSLGVDYRHDNRRVVPGTTYNPANGSYDAESRYRSRSYTLRASPSINGDMYVHNDAFVSLSGSSNLRYSNASDRRDDTYRLTESDSLYTYRSFTEARGYQLSLAIQPGWGRKYEGIYAATAIFVIDELRDNGLLQKEPTVSDMQQLTEIIYQFRLKHAIDYRLHKIEATQAISDFLISAGIISDGQPRRFFVIEDIWTYMPTVSRGFGFKTRVGIGTDYAYGYSSYEDSRRNQQSSYRNFETSENHPYIAAKAEFCKPLDLHWQLDCDFAFRSYFNVRITGINRGSCTRSERRYRHNYVIQGNVTINYMPTTRTRGILSTEVTHTRYHSQTVLAGPFVSRSESSQQQRYWYCYTNAQVSYRISLPVELTLRVSYSYQKEALSLTASDLSNRDYCYGSYDFAAGVAYNIF